MSPPRRTFRLTIAYDGGGYAGWQRQSSGTSIQELLEHALEELDGRPVPVQGAGRTDAGVHALGQQAGVSIERAIDKGTLVRALNARLPPAIRVLSAVEAPSDFHARFAARSKSYRYRLWNQEVLSPFEHGYVWHVPSPVLDHQAMAAAAALLEGRHDFAAFQAAGSRAASTERVVFSSRIRTSTSTCGDASRGTDELAGSGRPLIVYEIQGSGFLRHMVRNIVGTLVEIGRGRRPAGWVAEVLASKDRSRGGPTAPPEGLFLVGVEY
jgi:tRNA pseudouridine38-40 synthase